MPVFVASLIGLPALLVLAYVHWRTGSRERATVWAARILIVGILVVSPIAAYQAIREIDTSDYPWTLPGRPLGTYNRPTILGVGMVAVHGLLFEIAGVAAFFRPRIAIGVLVIIAVMGATSALLWPSDPSAPDWNWALALVIGPPLPAATAACLLWSLRRPLARPL